MLRLYQSKYKENSNSAPSLLPPLGTRVSLRVPLGRAHEGCSIYGSRGKDHTAAQSHLVRRNFPEMQML